MKILRFKKKLNEKVLFLIGVLVIISTAFIFYRGLFDTFFTQDEWWELGRAVDARTQGIKYYLTPWGGHFVPLMLFFLNLQFYLFGINIWPYAALAVLSHSLIAITLAFFVYRLTKKPFLGFLSGFIFAINTTPFHAVTYIAGGVTHIHGATILFLLSLILFAKYIASGNQKKYLVFSLVAIITSLLFMEYSAFWFFLVPCFYFIFSWERRKKISFWIDQAVILIVGIAFFAFRFFSQKIHIYGSQFIGSRTVESSGLEVENAVFDFFKAIVLNTAKLLPRIFYQVWAHEDFINNSTRPIFPNQNNFIVAMPIISIFLIALVLFVQYRKKQWFLLKLGIAAALLLVLGGFPAYVFPTFPNVIESRYLYLPSLGFSLLFALLLISLADFTAIFFKSKKYKSFAYILVPIIIVFPFFLWNFSHIGRRLKTTVDASRMRQKILRQAMVSLPHIEKRTVFYTISNLRTPGIPWPVSLGYTFLVMHTYNGDYKGGLEFFRSNKLWPVSEGFEQHREYSFGLFHDLVPLMKTLKQNNLSEENIYAFRWEATFDSRRNHEITHTQPPIYGGELVNITDEIRPMIKKLLDTSKFEMVASQVNRYFSSDIDVSFDRPSVGTFVNLEGILETAENSIPRLTTDGVGNWPGVLIEGPSYNFLLFSGEFDNDVWQKSNSLKVEKDVEVSPDGSKTAEKIFFGSKSDYIEQSVNFHITKPMLTNYSFSVYLKSPIPKKVEIEVIDGKGNGGKEEFIVGPNWQRMELTKSLIEGGLIKARIVNNVGEIYVWGAQLEEYAYPTSYIKTKDKPVFRGGDLFRAYPRISLPMNQGTISLWFRPRWNKIDTNTHVLFYNGENPDKNSVRLEGSSQGLQFVIMDNAGLKKFINHPWDFKTVKKLGWLQVAGTWRNGKMQLYFNGEPVGELSGAGSGMPKEGLTFGDPYRVGVHHGWFSLHADSILSRLVLKNRPLSASEIRELYLGQR